MDDMTFRLPLHLVHNGQLNGELNGLSRDKKILGTIGA